MKKALLIIGIIALTIALLCGCTPDSDENHELETGTEQGSLNITLNFHRSGTVASNQYAVWIENSDGELVRTLYVTRFTANGGYLRREDCIPTWVKKANPSALAETEIDAITGATPSSGVRRYVWDGKNEKGKFLPDGKYRICVEDTLYWSSVVLFVGEFQLGGTTEDVEITATYTESTDTNREMLTEVKATYFARQE